MGSGVVEETTDIEWKEGKNLTVRQVVKKGGAGKKVATVQSHFGGEECLPTSPWIFLQSNNQIQAIANFDFINL